VKSWERLLPLPLGVLPAKSSPVADNKDCSFDFLDDWQS